MSGLFRERGTSAGHRANHGLSTMAAPRITSVSTARWKKRVDRGTKSATVIRPWHPRGPMPSGPRLRIEKKGATAVLWIDNPPRNALRLSMISDLAARVPEIEKDDGIRALVVAGSGGLVFSSGVDME